MAITNLDDIPFQPGEPSGSQWPEVPSDLEATLRRNQYANDPPITIPIQTRQPTLVSMKMGDRFPVHNPEQAVVVDRPPRPTKPAQQEEVCIECAMRDEEMADVDVTSPGVWDRESDVWYEELVLKEREDERQGLPPSTSRPRAKGHFLTEHNVKLWLSMNPKESSARDSGVRAYVQTQIRLLEAESLARSQAAQESRVLSDQVRHTYSNLRRSAYELSPSTSLVAEDGVRIRTPRSASGSGFGELSGSEDALGRRGKQATLLQSGLIVEKVDLKEEERARRRRERSRQRANSRTSGRESVRTVPKAPSLRSLASSARPMSIATPSVGPHVIPALPSVRSQSHSSTEASATFDRSSRSPRFFNFKNWSGMMSRSSMALSGSMVDMHLALDEDAYVSHPISPLPSSQLQNGAIDLSSNAPSVHDAEPWNPSATGPPQSAMPSVSSAPPIPKKRTRISKILKIFGSHKPAEPTADITSSPPRPQTSIGYRNGMNEDLNQMPLAPPPPLSYLVERTRASSVPYSGRNASSSASITSSSLRNGHGMSPLTTGSSAMSSPTSARFRDSSIEERDRFQVYGMDPELAPPFMSDHRPSLHRVASENDVRSATPPSSLKRRATPPAALPFPASRMTVPPSLSSPLAARPVSFSIDKDLPPLPPPDSADQRSTADTITGDNFVNSPVSAAGEPFPRQGTPVQPTEQLRPPGPAEARRQSFSGLASTPFTSQSVNFGTGVPKSSAYGEFGMSRRSLNQLDSPTAFCDHSKTLSEVPSAFSSVSGIQRPPTKRRSRFGLSALLGRRSQEKETTPQKRPHTSHTESVSFIAHPLELTTPLQQPSRPSTGSRNGYFVEQDRNFIAYRYPSASEQLNLPV